MQKSSVALGLFDGMHLGHRKVLERAYQQGRQHLHPVIFTFPPETACRKGTGGYIYPAATKIHLLQQSYDFEVICPAFEQVCRMSGEAFAKDILYHQLHAAHVVCGNDFRFGHAASYDVSDLKILGAMYDFTVELVEDVRQDGLVISSTEIRKLLQNGEIEHANVFLGEPYQIYETVSHGARLGRTIGFPTINQFFHENQLVPKFGVYASETKTPDGSIFKSLTNIGIKPTVGYQGLPLAETYIQDFSGDLYHTSVQVNLLKFIRPEKKFDCVEALAAQMQADLKCLLQSC